MMTALLTGQGKHRWAEIATAAPEAAEAFARLFPGTRVVCLHRACPDVAAQALHASPWGLSGPGYATFTSAHPASTAAALTAYWVARTEALLVFEQAQPGLCHRLRYEDLTPDSLAGLAGFLGLQDTDPRPASWLFDDPAGPAPGTNGPDSGFPVGQLPPALLKRADKLMEQLGYASLTAHEPVSRIQVPQL
jgi:hypothetical protein